MYDLKNIAISFSTGSDNNLICLLLCGGDQFDSTKKQKKIMATIAGLMSNFFDNLATCCTYVVIFVCRFGEGFVLPFQRVNFIRYFI